MPYNEDALVAAARALVSTPRVGGRVRAGDEIDDTLPWYGYEWDGSQHCIGCGSGEWHDDARGIDGYQHGLHAREVEGGYLLRPDGYYNHPDCPAYALHVAVLAQNAEHGAP